MGIDEVARLSSPAANVEAARGPLPPSSASRVRTSFGCGSAYRSGRSPDWLKMKNPACEHIGNTIVLLNNAKTPATISYLDLVWVERWSLLGVPIPFTHKIVDEDSPIDPSDGYDETIAPHGTHHLVFREAHHFNWGIQLKHDIYLSVRPKTY